MQREINFRMMCAEETEDYWECKLHKKQVSLNLEEGRL